MLRSLDLFTGVGGITHALRGFATPAMYCEIDTHAQAVLRKLMAGGKLPRAPLHDNVMTLDGTKLRGKVDLISAGSPCVGFSSSGKREGFDNEQSGLFVHVVRLIHEIRPPFVFLENVAAIVEHGLDGVLATLTKEGYNATWVVLYAYHAGSPQHRRRWFCLATRPDALGKSITSRVAFAPFKWGREPFARMTAKRVPHFKNRMAMMGNSVVPDLVRAAFCWMYSGGTMSLADAPRARTMTLRLPEATGPLAPTNRLFGVMRGGKTYAIAEPRGLPPQPDLKLVLVPNAVPKPAVLNPATTTEILTKPHALKTWATPRRSITGGARVLTQRCKQDLPTQLRFERGTPNAVRLGYVNPGWVEWLMGFEPGWTLVPGSLPETLEDPDELAQDTTQQKPQQKKSESASVKAPSSSKRVVASAGGRGTRSPADPRAKRTLTTRVSSVRGRSRGSSTRESRTK